MTDEIDDMFDGAEGWVEFRHGYDGDGDDTTNTPWMSAEEAANYLGISKRKLEMMAEDTPANVNKPWRKLGRTVRWRRDEIDQWVDALDQRKQGRGKRRGT